MRHFQNKRSLQKVKDLSKSRYFCYNQLSEYPEEEHVPGTAVGQGRIGAVQTLFVHKPCRQSLLSEHAASIAPLGPAIAEVVS
jgi:hypothetical protein